MENKFKVGDRVVCNGFLGRVINIDDSFAEDDELYYDVEWDDGEVETVKESDIKPIDLRAAFLSDLKDLLKKYDANIEAYQSDFEGVSMDINIGDKYTITRGGYENIVGIDAENIMDYEEE